ncbi:MAG: hypothetical protein CVU35_00390 [Betaproteobacteria bacterium HGW-Betaproteobacteria-8]|nr:MAG: hypothetical protein CVU35_00390 [Betaproteobacteria bacterium HGW-Betaproteobacteria-8]
MNLKKMSLREQILTLFTVAVFVFGGYGMLRFYPMQKNISEMSSSADSMDKAVKTGRIPDAPPDDVRSLHKELEELSKELENAQIMTREVEKKLSGPDTTALRLAISEVARNAMVRIDANEEFRVTGRAEAAGGQAAQPTKTKNVSRNDRKRMARNARARAARTAQAGGGMASAIPRTTATVSPNMVADMVSKMGIGAELERPMQRLTMEGTYAGLMRFLKGLEELDKMVTVVQMTVAQTPNQPPPGYNQRLTATFVIAL